jgi:hypothetical protein
MLRPVRRINLGRSWQLAREQYAAVVSERDLLRRQLETTRWELSLTKQSLVEGPKSMAASGEKALPVFCSDPKVWAYPRFALRLY